MVAHGHTGALRARPWHCQLKIPTQTAREQDKSGRRECGKRLDIEKDLRALRGVAVNHRSCAPVRYAWWFTFASLARSHNPMSNTLPRGGTSVAKAEERWSEGEHPTSSTAVLWVAVRAQRLVTFARPTFLLHSPSHGSSIPPLGRFAWKRLTMLHAISATSPRMLVLWRW